MKLINITSFGHGKPEFHNDLKLYLKSVFKDIKLEAVENNEELLSDGINILFEGFWRDQDKFLSSKFSENKNGVMGLLNTEIKFYTYNNYYLQKKMIEKKNIKTYLFFIHYLWLFKEKVINLLVIIKKYRFFNKILYPLIYILKKISKSNYQVTHNETGFIAYFFILSTHFKDIYQRTWKHFDKFDFILNIGSETLQKKIFQNKKKYFFLPFVYSKNYADTFNVENIIQKNKDKTIDFLFTGALTEYRLKLLENLKKNSDLKIEYTDLEQDHKKRLETLSKTKFLLGLKQNQFQTFISVNRIYNAIITEIPILVEGENYFTPSYFHDFIYLEKTETFLAKMKEMSKNYDFYKNDFVNKKKLYLEFSEKHKEELKEFIKQFNPKNA